jgi:hypothetical protein
MFHRTECNPVSWQPARLCRLLAVTGLILWLLTISFAPVPLYGHGGGVPRLTGEIAGPYRIFAWTQPEPLHVGDIHLSIAVVKGAPADDKGVEGLDEPVTDAAVMVQLRPTTGETAPITIEAVLQEQLGSYYYEADATLPTPGEWRFTIEVRGALGEGSAAFATEVLAARRINWLLVAVAGLLLCCLLGLIGLWNRMQAKG